MAQEESPEKGPECIQWRWKPLRAHEHQGCRWKVGTGLWTKLRVGLRSPQLILWTRVSPRDLGERNDMSKGCCGKIYAATVNKRLGGYPEGNVV